MGKQFRCAVAIASLIFSVGVSDKAIASTVTAAQMTDVILQRLDALEKRSERLEKAEAENAALRERIRNLEKSKAPTPVVGSHVANVNSAYAAATSPGSVATKRGALSKTKSNWAGIYWGASVGGVVTQSETRSVETSVINVPSSAPPNNIFGNTAVSDGRKSKGGGATLDLFAGFNTMINSETLFGFQFEGSLAQINFRSRGTKSYTYFDANGPNGATGAGQFRPHVYARWMASALARGGLLTTPSTYFYGIGGWTFASFEYHNVTDNLFYQPGETFFANGVTGGVGIEKKINADWSVRAEYRYTHFMPENVGNNFQMSSSAGTPFTQSQTMQSRFENEMHVIRLGVAYLVSIE